MNSVPAVLCIKNHPICKYNDIRSQLVILCGNLEVKEDLHACRCRIREIDLFPVLWVTAKI